MRATVRLLRGTHQRFGQIGGPGAQLPAVRLTGEIGQREGPTVTGSEDLTQLQHVLNDELFVRVPRALPARLAPKE